MWTLTIKQLMSKLTRLKIKNSLVVLAGEKMGQISPYPSMTSLIAISINLRESIINSLSNHIPKLKKWQEHIQIGRLPIKISLKLRNGPSTGFLKILSIKLSK